MIAKKHVHDGRLILALCDNSILGKKFEEDEKILDFTSQFYNGEELDDASVLFLVKKSYIVNAAGKKVMEFLLKNDLISEDTPKIISGIPYVQIMFESG